MHTDDTWVVVADAGMARIFRTTAEMSIMDEVETLPHPASRAKTSELVSDKAGRANNAGAGRTAMSHGDPHEHEEEKAAHALAAHLHDAHTQHRFRDLVLVASPVFLGRLRGALSAQTAKAVTASVDRDYTLHAHDKIRELVKARLQEQPLTR